MADYVSMRGESASPLSVSEAIDGINYTIVGEFHHLVLKKKRLEAKIREMEPQINAQIDAIIAKYDDAKAAGSLDRAEIKKEYGVERAVGERKRALAWKILSMRTFLAERGRLQEYEDYKRRREDKSKGSESENGKMSLNTITE